MRVDGGRGHRGGRRGRQHRQNEVSAWVREAEQVGAQWPPGLAQRAAKRAVTCCCTSVLSVLKLVMPASDSLPSPRGVSSTSSTVPHASWRGLLQVCAQACEAGGQGGAAGSVERQGREGCGAAPEGARCRCSVAAHRPACQRSAVRLARQNSAHTQHQHTPRTPGEAVCVVVPARRPAPRVALLH